MVLTKHTTRMRFTLLMGMLVLASCSSNSNENNDVSEKDQTAKDSLANQRYTLQTAECLHTDLSVDFNFQVRFWRCTLIKNNEDSCYIKINIINKNTKEIVDSISYMSWDFAGTEFNVCTYGDLNPTGYRTTSYITGKDTTGLGVGNLDLDHGDIVIADLNFDGREDIALLRDWGKGRGYCYNYYIQNNNQHFELDTFLTDSMRLFPRKINVKNKTLTTVVELGTCGYAFIKHIYMQRTKENKWQEISRTEIGHCD